MKIMSVVCLSGMMLATTCKDGLLLQMQSATVQAWSGGVEGLSGINYQFVFSSARDFECKALYVKRRDCPYLVEDGLETRKYQGRYYVHMQISHDESKLPALKLQAGGDVYEEPPIECGSLPEFPGEAMLVLVAEGKTFRVEVDSLKRLPTQHYP